MAQPQNLTKEEMDEAVCFAVRMHGDETARDRERQAAADAIEEVGVPAEYLDRAAEQVRARRKALARLRRRRRAGVFGGAAAALAALGIWWAVHPGPVPTGPIAYRFDDPSVAYWQLDTTPGCQARVAFEKGGGADIHVQRLALSGGEEQYRVDLSTMQTPRTLTPYSTVRIRLRGEGLGQIRVFLENGNERWCSPFLTASGGWHVHDIPLDRFLRQTRTSAAYNWTDAPAGQPAHIARISLKLGAHANPETARGDVQIAELDFR